MGECVAVCLFEVSSPLAPMQFIVSFIFNVKKEKCNMFD